MTDEYDRNAIEDDTVTARLRAELHASRLANETALDLLQLLAREHDAESQRLGQLWSADPWLWGAVCMESRAHGAFSVQLGALANGLTMRFRPDLREQMEPGSTQAVDDADRGFVLHKSRAVMEAMLTNMAAARHLPYALGDRFTERSGVFVVVGAGPSLNTTGPELARLQQEGAVICTVNAALGAVSRYCVPDVVMTREVVDVSAHLRYPAHLYVMDMSASPKAWDVANEQEGADVAWFVPGASQCFKLAQAYGVRPLFGGTAAATAMVALCEEWGASSIVLVGMDFSTSAAKGSPWEGYDVDDEGRVGGAGYEAKKAAHASAGLPPPDAVAPAVMAHGWGGGVVRSLAQYADQVSWLEDFARRHPDIQCVDATGAGVRKRGWIERLAKDVDAVGRPASWRPTDVAYLSSEQHRAAYEHVHEQTRTAQVVAGNVVHEQGVPSVVPRFVRSWDIVDALAGGDMLRVVEASGTREERIRRMYAAIVEASERARGILER